MIASVDWMRCNQRARRLRSTDPFFSNWHSLAGNGGEIVAILLTSRQYGAVHFPRFRRRPPIFYGWYIVGVALVAQFVGAGTQAYAAGVFLKPMTHDLGWSRQDFSAVQTISTVSWASPGLSSVR